LAEGFTWLWRHRLLRTLAIVLGLLNMLGGMTFATFVLFGQEVLGTSATEFALLGTGGAIGGVVGGWSASWLARRLGEGRSLALTLIGGGITSTVIGFTNWWPLAWMMFTLSTIVVILWNVITVSFRQSVIPDELLGRVNSVYRFFGWGMIPVGAAVGGAIVVVTESVASRELALRMPWIVSGFASLALLAYAGPRLTSSAFAHAREQAATRGG
jgi:MFS family permease